jgi:hypothetical protein
MHNEIIVVLGNSSPVIYNARASHGLDLFLKKSEKNKNTFLLTKCYNTSWTLEHFKYASGDNKDRILNNEISDYYCSHKYTGDTITEAVGTRFVLENMYYNFHLNDSSFKVILTVVTSKCHEPRTVWIFKEVFRDIEDWIELRFDSSVTTFVEINENRYIKESEILNAQYHNVININGGMVNFINKYVLIKKHIHFSFEKDENFENKYVIRFRNF